MYRLSESEAEILSALIEHGEQERAAINLNMSDESLCRHLSGLRRKFNADNNAKLIAEAVLFDSFYAKQKRSEGVIGKDVIHFIFQLPQLISSESPLETIRQQLFSKTIYSEWHVHIDEFLIEATICEKPWIISLWDQWQMRHADEDVWKIKPTKENCFWVFRIIDGVQISSRIYGTATRAYAVYIKNELERIRCS